MNWKSKETKTITRLTLGNILYALPLPIRRLLKFARSFIYLLRLYKLHALRAIRTNRTKINGQSSPLITVCIPAYKSESWIEKTLDSLESQTMQDFTTLISVDGYDLETFEKLQTLLKNPKYTQRDSKIGKWRRRLSIFFGWSKWPLPKARHAAKTKNMEQSRRATEPIFESRCVYQIHLQHQRLGWVGNTNWLLTHAQTPFVCILPHDDIFHSFYLEELYRHLLRHPECLLVYTDTQMIGTDPSFKTRYFAQPSVKGTAVKRMESYLLHHLNAPGFRGLMRQEAFMLAGLIQENRFDHFAADTNWIGKIVKYGEIHRIPIALCTKRYHEKNTHTKWLSRAKEEQKEAWEFSCLELLDEFLKPTRTSKEMTILKNAAIKRFQQGCLRFRL